MITNWGGDWLTRFGAVIRRGATPLVSMGAASVHGVASVACLDRKPRRSAFSSAKTANEFIYQTPKHPPSPKVAYCGRDSLYEVPPPEPSKKAVRLAELEAENQDLHPQVKCLQSALASAAGLLMPYARRVNGSR